MADEWQRSDKPQSGFLIGFAIECEPQLGLISISLWYYESIVGAFES